MNLIPIIQALAGISWLAVISAIAYTVLRATRRQTTRTGVTAIILTVVLAVVFNTAAAGLVFIEPTERGVVITVFEEGVRSEPLQPGLKWVIPYAETVVIYPITNDTYTMSIANEEGQRVGDDSVEARTADGQVVKIDASVIFAVNPTEVVNVHIKWKNAYTDLLIRPQARGIIRDAVSQFGIAEVYGTERFTLSNDIQDELTSKLEEGGLILVDFVLRNVTFSEEYAASVEQKQIAEQLAQQAVFVVEQRKQEAEQARQTAQGLADAVVIAAQGQAQALLVAAEAEAEARLIRAQADAEALELLGEAIAQNPDVLTLEYIEKLTPNINVMLLPSDNPFLFPLPDVNQGQSATTPN